MSTQKDTLVRSTLLATVASVSFLPAMASGAVTLYTTEADLINDLTLAGGVQTFLEDFESHGEVPYGYAFLSSPLDSNPNPPFDDGIDPGLAVEGLDTGLLIYVPPYGPAPSSIVGGFQAPGTLLLDLTADDVVAVGFDVWGISSFIGGAPDEIQYTVNGVDGGVLGSGAFPTPDAGTSGQFFGVSSTDPIGSIEINGTRFGVIQEAEYIDNVQAWAIPPTGACCLPDSCVEVTEAECMTLGGGYEGDGSECGGSDPPELTCMAEMVWIQIDEDSSDVKHPGHSDDSSDFVYCLKLSWEASDDCGDPIVTAFIDDGYGHRGGIPVENCDLIDLTCLNDDNSHCPSSSSDSHSHVEDTEHYVCLPVCAETAVFTVTAVDIEGQETTCVIDLCPLVPGGDDDSHSDRSSERVHRTRAPIGGATKK